MVSDPEEARAATQILGSDLVKEADITSIPKFHGYVKAMVNKSPKPPALIKMLPPKNLAPLPGGQTSFDVPPRPSTSQAWAKAIKLARSAIDPDDLDSARRVVTFLRELDEDTWNQVVEDAQDFNHYQAQRLLADPSLRPDKVERAKTISRCLYGLPWWLREAHYWRVLRGRKKTGRPEGRETTGGEGWAP